MESKFRDLVQEIRSFNRFYTDILGLLNKHILDSQYSLTEVRVLFEIDKTKECTANMLMEKLNIDKGYLSRILKRFELNNLIRRENSPLDGRSTFLYLTVKGKDSLDELEDKSSSQISKMINHLSCNEQDKLIKTIKYLKNTLLDGLVPITIRSFRPDDIQYIIKRHRELYETEYNFSSEFGDYVEKFVREFGENYDSTKENIWVAEENNMLVGVIAIVKVNEATAQLRWFLVEPKMRGRGVGHKLMQVAIEFCKDKEYKHVLLWTVSTLEAARHLYKSYGFGLTETKDNDTWGRELTEERWDLEL